MMKRARSKGTVEVNDISLYYEMHGSGAPLVLIAGLGYASWLWWKQVPALSRHFTVITLDNRGVGQSDKPDIPYSIPLYASDTVGLLSALGIEQAAIFGVSMGGFIAQEIAMSYPQRVRALILGCTSFGGPRPSACARGDAIVHGPGPGKDQRFGRSPQANDVGRSSRRAS
jgi:pimeloyl-ACP methyl ester carboxylesterase